MFGLGAFDCLMSSIEVLLVDYRLGIVAKSLGVLFPTGSAEKLHAPTTLISSKLLHRLVHLLFYQRLGMWAHGTVMHLKHKLSSLSYTASVRSQL